MEYYRTDELYHHGIKGQKWGVRRYQNPDGTLTAEGQAHYFNPDGSLNKEGIKEEKKLDKALRFNPKLQAINEKYATTDRDYDPMTNKYTTDIGKKYAKEVPDLWNEIYTDEIKSNYPASLQVGYDYIQRLPEYDQFRSLY